MTKPNWIEQEYADIAAEIPDVVAGIRQAADERIARGDHQGAARWQAAAEWLEAEHERILNRFSPRPNPN